MITLEDLRAAVNAACTCSGSGPDDPNACPACEVWHALVASWEGATFSSHRYVCGRCRRECDTIMGGTCAACARTASAAHTGAPGNNAAIRESRDR